MYDTTPLRKIDERLNELEPILKVYFPTGICKANRVNPNLAASHLDIAGCQSGRDTYEFRKNSSILPCRFTQATHRIGGSIYLHCPLLSNEVIKLWKNKYLIVDAKPYIYILNAKKLLFILRSINHSESKITINGIGLHVDILKKYISINIEELIALVPELCIDRLEIFEKCFKTLKKKTMDGSHYYPLCYDNLIWPTFKLFISKCPSYVFAMRLNDRTVQQYVGIKMASVFTGCSESKIKKCLAGIQLRTRDDKGNIYGFFSEKQIASMGVGNEEELIKDDREKKGY